MVSTTTRPPSSTATTTIVEQSCRARASSIRRGVQCRVARPDLRRRCEGGHRGRSSSGLLEVEQDAALEASGLGLDAGDRKRELEGAPAALRLATFEGLYEGGRSANCRLRGTSHAARSDRALASSTSCTASRPTPGRGPRFTPRTSRMRWGAAATTTTDPVPQSPQRRAWPRASPPDFDVVEESEFEGLRVLASSTHRLEHANVARELRAAAGRGGLPAGTAQRSAPGPRALPAPDPHCPSALVGVARTSSACPRAC